MNIDFIKWMCDKAEGFVFGDFNDISVSGSGGGASMRTTQFEHVYYPLLLQRAIEGVNRDDTTPYLIMQNHRGVYYNTYDDPSEFDGSTEDKAKESALKYIYEQEQKQ